MQSPPRPPARALTKTELVHGELREAILTLVHPPGAYLNIDELARRHRLSPIPVREAVARLAAERLVIMEPHVGAVVAPLDATTVREIFALIAGLESAAAGDITARATGDDLLALTEWVKKLGRLHPALDLEAWDEANAAFHLRLAAIAELPNVISQLRTAFDHWGRVRRQFFKATSARRATQAQREHLAMIAAVKKKDPARLRDLLHEHNWQARETYLRLLPQ